MKHKWLKIILYILLLDFFVVFRLLMADHWYVKVLFYALPSFAIIIRIVTADKQERKHAFSNRDDPQISPYAAPIGLPVFLILLSVLFLPVIGLIVAISYYFSNFILVFLHISIYNAALMLLLPFLRKHFSSRVCATLWILPNVLYMAFIPLVQKNQPLLIIPMHVTVGNWLIWVWLIGFAGTMLYQIINHLLYRRKVLKNAQRDWDLNLQRVWSDILQNHRFKKQYYPVMRSAEVSTPLSIGIFRRSTCVVLPQKEYTLEELQLLLRHEAIHIARRDSLAKFFMVFCAAACWFNPLAWVALRQCSADLELSCDETVLLGEGEETKQHYAELLLKTAGDDRGFSTCLSASAKTMLYRISHVLNPPKRHLGAIIAGIATFLLLSTFGLVAVAYNPVTGDEIVTIANADWDNEFIYKVADDRTDYACEDIRFLLDYVSGITFYQLSGNYSYPDDDTLIAFYYTKTDYQNNYASTGVISSGGVELSLDDHTLTIIDFATGGTGVPTIEIYYHNAAIDWDYLLSQGTPVS